MRQRRWGFDRLPRVIAAALLGALAAGCSSSDSGPPSMLMAPGRYLFYSCQLLTGDAKGIIGRLEELERLMAKAGTDVGSRVVSTVTYRSDYNYARAELREIQRAGAEKNCPPMPTYPPPPPPERQSDSAIR